MLSLWALLALLLSLHLSQGLAASVLHHRADACNELLRGHFNSAIHSGSSVFAEDVIGNDFLSPMYFESPTRIGG